MIVSDATRADHLSIYGYFRNTTPYIDGFSGGAYVFDYAISQATWTKPSVASLFTSVYPTVHKTDMYELTPGYGVESVVLPSEFNTLAESLSGSGYATFGFVNNPFISPELNFGQGFDEYELMPDDVAVTEGALEAVRRLDGGSFFLYLHYLGPHAPYTPPDDYKTLFTDESMLWVDTAGRHQEDYLRMTLDGGQVRYLVSQYDAEIAYIDYQVSQVIQALEDEGVYDDTIVVFTSDHGEDFFDHVGLIGHRHPPYDSQVRVPLIIRIPGRDGGRIRGQVRLIDVMPTLLDLIGLPEPGDMDGVSLRKAFDGHKISLSALSEQTEQFIESDRSVVYRNKKISLRKGEWKYIYDLISNESLLYNLKEDPAEQNPVTDDIAREMHHELMEIHSKNVEKSNSVTINTSKISDESVKRLKELGYLSQEN